MSIGGFTDVVLHRLAIAYEARGLHGDTRLLIRIAYATDHPLPSGRSGGLALARISA
jgi:hypothetical protein